MGRDPLGVETRKSPEALEVERPPKLSDGAQFVRAMSRTLRRRGVTGDVFEHLARYRPEWTRERWEAARDELCPRPVAPETPKRVGGSVAQLLGLAGGGER